MSVFVYGPCRDARTARSAVDRLIESSFPPEEIRVQVHGEDGSLREAPIRHRTRAPLGALIGAGIGAVAAIALSGLPADVPAQVSSSAIQLLLGAMAVGAVTGASAGIYWWRKEAEIPPAATRRGDVLVGVTVPEGRFQEASDALRTAGAAEVRTSPPPPR